MLSLRPALLGSFLALAAAGPLPAPEKWEALSSTAMAITGDITMSPTRIAFSGGAALPLAAEGALAGFKADGKPVAATLYRVTVPADPALLNNNHLCGGGGSAAKPASFVVTWRPAPGPATGPESRALAVYSGAVRPSSDSDPTLCGTFLYDAAGSSQ
jgi:hypothetical protein